jgi:polyisoprenoid-binding protein YceI
MKTLRSFVPPLAAMLMAASAGALAQGVLIDRSEIRFVSKQMGASVEGRFRKWKANVDFRPNDLAKSKAEIEIELASIDLASEESEAETRRPTWFDTARFPVATFTSTGMKGLGGGRYEIAGTLAMKGVAKEVVVPVVLGKDAAGNGVAEGRFTLKRLAFGIGEGVWADTDAVADDVVVRVRLVLPPFAQ